jgi:hypothetical protein
MKRLSLTLTATAAAPAKATPDRVNAAGQLASRPVRTRAKKTPLAAPTARSAAGRGTVHQLADQPLLVMQKDVPLGQHDPGSAVRTGRTRAGYAGTVSPGNLPSPGRHGSLPGVVVLVTKL